jgi:hypothetical protein
MIDVIVVERPGLGRAQQVAVSSQKVPVVASCDTRAGALRTLRPALDHYLFHVLDVILIGHIGSLAAPEVHAGKGRSWYCGY